MRRARHRGPRSLAALGLVLVLCPAALLVQWPGRAAAATETLTVSGGTFFAPALTKIFTDDATGLAPVLSFFSSETLDTGISDFVGTGSNAFNSDVAIAERPPLPIHPKFWRELGLDPRKADAIVQKNFFHYRMFYAALSFHHVPVVTAGATSLGAVRERVALATKRRGLPTHEWRLADPALRALARRAEMRHLPEAR